SADYIARRIGERVHPVPVLAPDDDVRGHRWLEIDAAERAVVRVLRRQGKTLSGKTRRHEKQRVRRALVLVRAEVLKPVSNDRPPERAADLRVRDREPPMRACVRRRELIAAKVSVESAAVTVSPGARDGLHLLSERTALRDVEQIRDDLEFGDGLAAQPR